jgi:hypothetical protein
MGYCLQSQVHGYRGEAAHHEWIGQGRHLSDENIILRGNSLDRLRAAVERGAVRGRSRDSSRCNPNWSSIRWQQGDETSTLVEYGDPKGSFVNRHASNLQSLTESTIGMKGGLRCCTVPSMVRGNCIARAPIVAD